ncbi:SusD/RagB family nutrient-binding outer membrane lipoprotein [Litoribacter alkaliphilus]|uniref:SusD/RagB family nutrient-binding outer membrane lipoprotein n=1 Tax=Litoribacter ruber TaxID=702568 RepID=A0AAP2CEN7_9BACT|nr:SusD/RagB family nutrient-binding outer membrane lipoprotein [Litoribacter alkaliphilus]MBS9523096.1 SusD/RagB family nutrient-binding outer membrane lipoprotein [Litoribacter alkaliphilus]
MKSKILSLVMAFSLVLVSSCDLDLLDDPNVPTRENASPEFLLNQVQVDFADFFNTTGNIGMRLTRMINQPSNTYQQAWIPQSFNPIWSTGYVNVLNNIALIETLVAEGDVPNERTLAIAQTIKAYTLMTLVDHFGEVPWSEALSDTNFSPVADDGASVYQAAFDALQEARANFTTDPAPPVQPTDLYYGRNYARWLRLVNTLELKYHLNRRLIDAAGSTAAINALIAGGELLQEGDDFYFQYGTSLNDPDSRHPRFATDYTSGGNDYQSTWYMWHLTEEGFKGFNDPRIRYYLYRQVTANPTDPDKLRCISELPPAHYLVGGFPFCLPGNRGYWGRDHLNPEGIPPDNLERTVWGLYPAGGRFDNNSASPVNNPLLGNQGAGIQPIMLSAFVDFMLAEAAQTLGTTGDPREYLTSAITKHMNFVRSWALTTNEAEVVETFQTPEAFATAVTNYVNFVGGQFDAASGEGRMRVIGREYWLSLYGNGVEAYNLYRRTGQPDNMQPGLLPNFGTFPRSFLYPNNYLTTNANASQRAFTDKVFWDNNPDGFID